MALGRFAAFMAEAAGRGELALQECAACGRVQYPPRELCAECLSERLDWHCSGEVAGVLLAETALHHSHEPAYRGLVPLPVGLVRLACGDAAVAFLAGPVAVGSPVSVSADVDFAGRAVLIATPPGKGFQGLRPWRGFGGSAPNLAVLITGGSAGIGLALVQHFLAAGYFVTVLDRQPCPLSHPRLSWVRVDLTDPEATQAAVAGLSFTVLIHNAGAMRPALLADVTIADMEALAALHLGSALVLMQAGLPAMQAAGFGRVVLVSSRAALGLATRTAYAATKAGMIGMARSWALELAPAGVTVNVVAPGPIETDMFHEILPQGDARIARLAATIPVRRIGRPDDVARAVLFLADPANSFITGQTLFVCGGTSIGSLAL
jgi:NAD(P)-dependent dehydrogenase (short-subunit alcohol dehydrogenase family)/uncharacterized OB-fold protein